MEAVFRAEIFGFYSRKFRSVPAGNHRKLAGIHRKKIRKFPLGILLPCSSDFRCFPAGSSDFPASFLQVPAGSGHRNVRHGYLLSYQYFLFWHEREVAPLVLLNIEKDYHLKENTATIFYSHLLSQNKLQENHSEFMCTALLKHVVHEIHTQY